MARRLVLFKTIGGSEVRLGSLELEEGTQVKVDGAALGYLPPPTNKYQLAVEEAHKILDEMGIASAKEIHCDDPECHSSLGHRLRDLRTETQRLNAVVTQAKEVAKATAAQAVIDALNNIRKKH